MSAEQPTVPYGYCHCGCGARTKIARASHRPTGAVKGQPRRYLIGHHRRKAPIDYIEDPRTGCWLWQRGIGSGGYAAIKVNGMRRQAHRVLYEHHVGPIPAGMQAHHICETPRCVNPGHIEILTPAAHKHLSTQTKLTASTVREIRTRAAAGESKAAIARAFGVSRSHVSSVVHGHRWAGVL